MWRFWIGRVWWAGFLVVCTLSGIQVGWGQSVGIGTTDPDTTAILDIFSTDRGLLIPRLTTAQRNAIQDPAHTLMIFNIDSFCVEVYDTVLDRWHTLVCPRYCRVPECVVQLVGPEYLCSGQPATFVARCLGGCQVAFRWVVPSSWQVVWQRGDTLVVLPDTTDGMVEVAACNLCGCGSRYRRWLEADTCNTFCARIPLPGGDEFVLSVNQNSGLRKVILAGFVTSFGSGGPVYGQDALLVQVTPEGVIDWLAAYGDSTADEELYYVSPTVDSGWIACGVARTVDSVEVYVVRVDGQGQVLWQRRYGKGDCWYIRQLSTGGYFLSGGWSGASNSGFVMWLDSAGQIRKLIRYGEYGTLGITWFRAAYLLSSGRVYAGGESEMGGLLPSDVVWVKLDTGTGQVVSEHFLKSVGVNEVDDRAFAFVPLADGTFLLAGRHLSGSWDSSDLFLIRIDTQGNILRSVRFGSKDHYERLNNVSSVAVLPDSTVLVAAYTAYGGDLNGYVVRFTPDLSDTLWTLVVGSQDLDLLLGVVPVDSGLFLAAGITTGFGAVDGDIFLVRGRLDGTVQCPVSCFRGRVGRFVSAGVPVVYNPGPPVSYLPPEVDVTGSVMGSVVSGEYCPEESVLLRVGSGLSVPRNWEELLR